MRKRQTVENLWSWEEKTQKENFILKKEEQLKKPAVERSVGTSDKERLAQWLMMNLLIDCKVG